jgi:hypothetical protein
MATLPGAQTEDFSSRLRLPQPCRMIGVIGGGSIQLDDGHSAKSKFMLDWPELLS